MKTEELARRAEPDPKRETVRQKEGLGERKKEGVKNPTLLRRTRRGEDRVKGAGIVLCKKMHFQQRVATILQSGKQSLGTTKTPIT